MSIQSYFNSEAIMMLENTNLYIKSLNDRQERSNAVCITLKMVMNTIKPISEMTKKELSNFDNKVLERISNN